MSPDDLQTLRNDIAFYACLVCSVATRDTTMAAVWIVLAICISVFSKFKRRRPQLCEGDKK